MSAPSFAGALIGQQSSCAPLRPSSHLSLRSVQRSGGTPPLPPRTLPGSTLTFDFSSPPSAHRGSRTRVDPYAWMHEARHQATALAEHIQAENRHARWMALHDYRLPSPTEDNPVSGALQLGPLTASASPLEKQLLEVCLLTA